MAQRAAHLEQARENRRVAELALSTWPDDPTVRQWAVTMAFYCAVHCVEAYLADRGQHSLNHRHRDQLLSELAIGFPADARDAYEQLKQWSEGARYLPRSFTFDQVRVYVLGATLPEVTAVVGL